MKKIFAMLLVVATLFAFTACGGGSSSKDEAGVLTINVYQGGYGSDWADAVANKFTAKTGIKTKVEKFIGKNGVTAIRTDVTSGISGADLIITKDMMFDEIYKGKRTINGVEYDNLFEDLTPLYNKAIEGESVTLKDKMDSAFAQYYNIDGKYYAAPWASGMIGLIRNKDVWDNSWEVPNTTDELFALADVIKATKAPFIYAEGDEYWSMFSHVWIAQYKGSEGMQKFYDGYNADDVRYEANIFEDEAFESTLRILEKLLKKENKYMHPSSLTISFTNMQGSFLQGNAVMTPNGDWIEREMAKNYKDSNIEFIKTPVNSAVADRCSFKNEADRDNILSSLIDYVDANPQGYEGKPANVTNGDVDVVRDARAIEYTVGHEHFMAIPSYSKEKEEAKKFISYLASDEGIKTYIENTNGCLLPYEYNLSAEDTKFSDFRKSTTSIINRSKLMFASRKNRLFSLGGVDMYWYNDKSSERVIPSLSAIEKEDYHSATEISRINNEYLKKHWATIKKQANI